MEDFKVLRLVYTIFVGLLLTVFVGVGINTFYSPPKAPEYPVALNTYNKEPTTAQIAQQQEYEIKRAQHDKAMKPYNRNVSIITLAVSIAFLAASMILEGRIKVIADGIMLGGLFTLIYSIGRGFASESSGYIFTVVAIGLAVVLYLGYRRFIRPQGLTPKGAKPS